MGRIARALAARLLQAVLVSLGVATLCFAAMHLLPGDLAMQVAAARYGDGRFGAAAVEAVRHSAGLDQPLAVQYWEWLRALASLDAGRSLVTGRPVWGELADRIGITLTVGGWALLLAVVAALPMGALAGWRPGGVLDRCVATGSALLASAPSFVVGALLVAGLAVNLGWFPVAGSDTPRHLVLPTVALALALVPGLAQVMRHGAAEASGSPYVAFARMRGVSPWRVTLQVAARPALLPVAAYLPVLAVQVVEGFVAIELVFNLDGIGRLLVRSVLARDIPLVAGAGILFALLLSALSLAGDVLLHWLNPLAAPVPA